MTLPKDQLDQPNNVQAMVVFGHAANTITREPAARAGFDKLDLLVVVDPHPTTFAISGNRKNGTYLLPGLHGVREHGHA